MASTSSLRDPRRRPSSGSFQTRVARKIPKARPRSQDAMVLPDRFKTEEEDDVDDGTGIGGDDPLFAQQSICGMLAAAQSNTNFQARFQQDSGSESEGEEETEKQRTSRDRPKGHSLEDTKRTSAIGDARQTGGVEVKGHRKRLSEHSGKLVRSFLKPHAVREREEVQTPDPMTQSQFLPALPEAEVTPSEPPVDTNTPILDRKLRAMARAGLESSMASSIARRSTDDGRVSSESPEGKGRNSLSQVIAHMFHFEEPEEVLAEYPCWYLQNVMLQGYMYVTQNHVCFYAYLQKKTNVAVKTGHIGKQGKHSYGYRRRWFVLKGDIFAYYKDSAQPYFPLGQVDLRYAISADLSKEKDKEEQALDFTITTPSRLYLYRADTPHSARDWVKHLQNIIFRSHNDSDSVKISLAIEDIVDVEQTSFVGFSETVKLRAVASDETFAMDDFFFSFSHDKEALKMLKSLVDANGAKTTPPANEGDLPSSMDQSRQLRSAPRLIQEPTMPSSKSSRPSRDQDRTGMDRGRRSVSGAKDRSLSPRSPSIDESSESFVTTSEHAASSSANDETMDDDMSASQMLTGDGVFRGPTLRMPQTRPAVSGIGAARLREESQQSSRDSSAEPLGLQASTRVSKDLPIGQRKPDLQHRQSGGSNRTAEADTDKSQMIGSAPGRLVTAPLQHAMAVADIVRSSGKRMGSYLSSSPKTYLGNWSAAIAGGKRHYTDAEGIAPDDSIREPEQDADIAEHERRFREHFGLPPTEKLLAVFYCWLHKTVPLYGKIYMSTRRFCFRSLWYGTNTKLVVAYKDIINVQKQRGFRWGYPGMVLVIRGYEELFFDFGSVGLRDDAVVTVLRSLETGSATNESMILTEEELQDAEAAAAENELLQAARDDGNANRDLQLPRNEASTEPDTQPILFDDPSSSVLDFKPEGPLRITCLTIGSRGDVQPYIALCKGLMAEGHKCKIATHREFQDWVEKHGIEFAEVGGDPAELMRVCVENGMFTPAFLLEVNSRLRGWLDELLQSAWVACQDSDLLIESPSAMCGIHIAEALEIPYFRAFTMPWTRTRTYPQAFAVPTNKRGGSYNYMTYTFFDNLFWRVIAGQINRWRGKTLGIGPTNLDKLQQNKVPFLYNFSPNVVPAPLDFSHWIKITGYWFLDEGEEWEPPEDLALFIKKAKDDDQKLVYIGFGSVTVADSKQLVQQIVDAVVKADVRCILAKGWSDRNDKGDPTAVPIELPSCVHQIVSAPHDWLFRQVDAVVHHGGAGTTGASLRAGKPTIIRPFFGDQYFFATRVEDLGVGHYLDKVTAHQLGKALWIATHDTRMRNKAAALGKAIRAEDGVTTAIKAIYRDLNYAKDLVKKRALQSGVVGEGQGKGGNEDDGAAVALEEETEENWTFVEMEGKGEAPMGGEGVAGLRG